MLSKLLNNLFLDLALLFLFSFFSLSLWSGSLLICCLTVIASITALNTIQRKCLNNYNYWTQGQLMHHRWSLFALETWPFHIKDWSVEHEQIDNTLIEFPSYKTVSNTVKLTGMYYFFVIYFLATMVIDWRISLHQFFFIATFPITFYY